MMFTVKKKGKDARRDKRVKPPAAEPIEIQIMGTNSLDILKANDISISGIGINVPHRFEGCNISEEVELVITLPNSRPFLARGVISHISSSKQKNDIFGIQFTSISNNNSNQIKGYIEQIVQRYVQ